MTFINLNNEEKDHYMLGKVVERILLVEDNTELRFTVAEWLRMEKFEVVEAGTGDEAATILSSILNVDLVLTDVQMPGRLDGLGLTQLIKQKFPEIPVVVASGATSRTDALDLGASAFFTKPYDLEKLTECIQTLMPRRESDRIKGNGLKRICHER